VLRGIFHYSTYERDDTTAANFDLAPDHGMFSVRTGLRWGGKEPTLYPSVAMELSIWYQGEFRTRTGSYGFDGDRTLKSDAHLFWGQALLAYTLPHSNSFYVGLTAGTSVDADRFSAYRLGALLPLVSEFPLSLPGYYYQEISATKPSPCSVGITCCRWTKTSDGMSMSPPAPRSWTICPDWSSGVIAFGIRRRYSLQTPS